MKFKQLWICGHSEQDMEEVSFQCLAYTREPVHGAIKGLTDNYIEKAAYDKAIKALRDINSECTTAVRFIAEHCLIDLDEL